MSSTISGNGVSRCRDKSAIRHDSRYGYVDNIQDLLASLVETACEHEKDLNLMRLLNYVDLYRFHIEDTNRDVSCDAGDNRAFELNENTESFESFVSSSSLLNRAAASASKHYGDEVAAPVPLKLSANDSRLRAGKAPACN